MATYFDNFYATFVIFTHYLLNDLSKLNRRDLKLIFSLKENFLLPLVTASKCSLLNPCHPLMVTIVFPNKCWGIGVRYESCNARVRILQIDSVNELKELPDV